MSLELTATPEPPAADVAGDSDSDMSSYSDEHKRATSPAHTSQRLMEMDEKINQLQEAVHLLTAQGSALSAGQTTPHDCSIN